MCRLAACRPAGALLFVILGTVPLQVARSARLRSGAEGPNGASFNTTGVQALVSVKSQGSGDTGGSGSGDSDDLPTPKEIHEKWDKMDDFLEIMFVMACKWKHGKEIHDEAAHAFNDSKISANEVENFKRQKQAQNLVELKAACGNIVARGKGKCRQSCSDRWGTALKDRARCQEKCVKSYDSFERECTSKADSLELVYEMRLKAAQARKQCHEGYCAEFPSVWLKKKENMQTEADARCDDYCEEEKLKARCENRWALQYDMVLPGVKSGCTNSSADVQKCFSDNATKASSVEETCQSDGKQNCTADETKCNTDGKTDQMPVKEGKEFCAERRKMCEGQVVARCLAEYKASLQTAKAECERADLADVKNCVNTTMAQKETSTISKCEQDKQTSCPKECAKLCDAGKLADCLEGLESENDAAEMFCTDFWKLIHESSQVDPESGEPIVLLDPTMFGSSNASHKAKP